MKIAVLTVDNKSCASYISNYEPDIIPSYYFNVFSRYKISCEVKLSKKNSLSVLNRIKNDFDIFVNLCDGAKGDDRPGIEVTEFLEKNKLNYTGADPFFYEPTREQMKHAAKINKIMTPKSYFFYSKKEFDNFNKLKFCFPCVVKHYCSYGSVGMTKDSVVYNYDDLSKEVYRFIENFGGVLVEKYIEGKEYTVLIVSYSKDKVITFEPVEVVLPEGEKIKHFNLKWQNHNLLNFKLIDNKHVTDLLKEYSFKIYTTMRGNGYARFDFREDNEGNLYFLELNPNCSIFYPQSDPSSADVILALNQNGYTKFIDSIINFALVRHL
ncbi:MAG: hypothetical protein N3A01_05715 [Bacteroidales bacterium]|nr:hypothetical protein [Bacteroidales bacterium]